MGKPLERQNLSVLFTSLVVLIAGSTAWCFWQEFVTRRPWIAYQDNFNKSYLVPKSQHDLTSPRPRLRRTTPSTRSCKPSWSRPRRP